MADTLTIEELHLRAQRIAHNLMHDINDLSNYIQDIISCLSIIDTLKLEEEKERYVEQLEEALEKVGFICTDIEKPCGAVYFESSDLYKIIEKLLHWEIESNNSDGMG